MGEDDAEYFCAQSGMGLRSGGDTLYAYREWDFLGHGIYEVLGVWGILDLLH